MNEEQKYLFDLTGYLLLRDVLSAEELQALNAGIDQHIETLEPLAKSTAGDSKTLAGTSRRNDMGDMLAWERPWCEPFRKLLVHPTVKPVLEGILGRGYRLDHGPGLIAMDAGGEGCTLHGGGADRRRISQAVRRPILGCGYNEIDEQGGRKIV